MHVSVVIPTLNRPDPLMRAIASVQRQQLPADVDLQVIVVDNSSEGRAQLPANSAPVPLLRYPMTWLHEPNPGVASARNRGVAAAQGEWIAFLDDDEEADPTWIARHCAIARETGADAVFGPIDARPEFGDEYQLSQYFTRAITKPDGSDITYLAAYLGTNNSMFRRVPHLTGGAPFDTGLDATGGEDSLLLKQLVQSGCRFAWASGARVIEWVPEARLRWSYVRQRKFLSGQIRVFVLRRLRPAHWGEIAFWMGVGLVQALGAGGTMIMLRPFRGSLSRRASVVCCAGLGKVLWMPHFRPALYGTGLVS